MAKILKIITHPNKILRTKSKTLKPEDITSKKILEMIKDMKATMLKKDGIGLAAPQIGQNIRIIAINTKDGPICAINPEIIKKSFRQEWDEEGCLSVPDTFGKVKRYKKIKCRYTDETGKTLAIEANGLMARVFQHEIDHLDGILFIDIAKDTRIIKRG